MATGDGAKTTDNCHYSSEGWNTACGKNLYTKPLLWNSNWLKVTCDECAARRAAIDRDPTREILRGAGAEAEAKVVHYREYGAEMSYCGLRMEGEGWEWVIDWVEVSCVQCFRRKALRETYEARDKAEEAEECKHRWGYAMILSMSLVEKNILYCKKCAEIKMIEI